MENWTNLLLYMPLVLVAAAVLMWLGFKVPPRLVVPDVTQETSPRRRKIKESLPPLVRAFLKENLGDPALAPRTAVLWGRGRFAIRHYPLIGTLWAPLRWVLYLRPGYEYVWRINLSWYRTNFLSGGDELRQGKGRFVMAGRAVANENLDLSETTMMWLFSLLGAPGTLAVDERVEWLPLDEQRVRMRVPFAGERTWDFDLTFDPAANELVRVDTQRTTSRSGVPEPFQVQFSQYMIFDEGLALPGKMRAAWGDDFYVHLNIEGVLYNAGIDEALKAGV